jgi:hypothetical protein
VQDQKEVLFEREDDALAETPEVRHFLAERLAQRRRGRAHEKRALEPDAEQRATSRARGEVLHVERDIGKLRHFVRRR